MMNTHRNFTISFISLALVLILAGCGLLEPAPLVPTVDQSLLFTQAAGTLMAQFTQVALVSTATALAAPVQPTPEAPTPTPLPLPTETPSPTSPPTATPTSLPSPTLISASATPAPPTAAPLPCLAAKFVKDVTVPDGTRFNPGASFTKTWQLQNTGSCSWDEDFSIVFVDGDQLGGDDSVPLPDQVNPGERVNVSVDLVAPNNPGTYRGDWMLEDDAGERFGLGSKADRVFWVEIRVKEVDSGTAYSFVEAVCQADWESSEADELPCPGEIDDPDGFVVVLDEPDQENRRENEPALWTNPARENDGWIKGTFPAIKIKDGDHFLADVGCLADYTKCLVIFEVSYQVEGKKAQSLGTWHEEYDGEITRIDIDLSDLSGKSVKFILTVKANGSFRDDAAFWLVPQIAR